MEDIRDLLFQQETLNLLLKKWGVSEKSTLIPWSNGFALTDQSGNITNYLNIDSNGQLLLQEHNFSAVGSVSSVSNGQYQIYNNHHLVGNLFNNPDSFTEYLNLDQNGTAETLSQVLDIDVDSVDSLLNITDIIDVF
jgi:hypothetical protein